MNIALDMDNTIADELGSTLRPGMLEFLEYLRGRHTLYVFTNSRKQRAIDTINHFKLREYFEKIIAREDYDAADAGKRKDLRQFNLDVLIDDDPAEVEFAHSIGRKGILVKSYRKGSIPAASELNDIIRKFRL